MDGGVRLGVAFKEADLRSALKEGREVFGAFIGAHSKYTLSIWLRCYWIQDRGFRIIR